MDLNFKDKEGYTPLFYAVSCRNPKVVEHLLQWGADPNVFYSLPGATADISGPFVLWLIGSRPLFGEHRDFSDTERKNYLELAFKYGADPNLVDPKNGRSLIFNLVRRVDSKEYFEFLKNHGANVNHVDATGATVLVYQLSGSIPLQDIDTIKALLEFGVDPRIMNAEGLVANDYLVSYLAPLSQEEESLYRIRLQKERPNFRAILELLESQPGSLPRREAGIRSPVANPEELIRYRQKNFGLIPSRPFTGQQKNEVQQ